ncbi:MAG: SiaB family protein kinase [Cytophagales bacterium]|nr:SiaB family protein kinase [Cytophagales bacterium]MDW8383872.1 SiaB family protein kinase [Flammeovirgaceae bacterium]
MPEEKENYFSVKDFKNGLVDHNIHMVFTGMFSQDVLSLIGLNLRKNPNSEVISKRLFALVVEMSQNILHYSAEREYSAKDKAYVGVGVISIGEDDEFYLVRSGNLVDNKSAKEMKERAEFINSLSEEELKEYYKAQRKMPQREGKPGANLGFIDMRRKSGYPLEVYFEPVDDQHSFYVLSVKVKKNSV